MIHSDFTYFLKTHSQGLDLIKFYYSVNSHFISMTDQDLNIQVFDFIIHHKENTSCVAQKEGIKMRYPLVCFLKSRVLLTIFKVLTAFALVVQVHLNTNFTMFHFINTSQLFRHINKDSNIVHRKEEDQITRHKDIIRIVFIKDFRFMGCI